MPDWKSYFKHLPGTPDRGRQECTLCGTQLDVRAGRAQKHLANVHPGVGGTTEAPGERPDPPPDKEPASGFSSKHPKGSREWGIDHILYLIDNPGLTPDARLKAIAELREWESFEGSGKFDDEVEREKHMEQWERAIKRSRELRDLEKKILRDQATRQDLLRVCVELDR